MSIWPRPMQRAVPITDPRWLASTQPDREPEPKVDVHWFAGESTMTWNNPVNSIACDPDHVQADFDPKTADIRQDKVTCAKCLNVVMRRRCLALEDVPGPLPQRCTRPPHDDERHSWAVARTEHGCWPSGVLPVRVPGAALTDAEGPSGVEGPAKPERAAESNVEREVLETWTA